MSAESGKSLLSRIVYAIRMGVRFRASLVRILREATPEHPWEISIQRLRSTGAKVIALDFDGVLAPYGDDRPSTPMLGWLKRCVGQFGGENVFVLSNNPSRARIEFFRERFPSVRWLTDFQPKPYPDGLERVISLRHVAPREVLLVDDRLMTGALCACITKVNVYYVRRPIVDLSKRTFRELFFMTLRGMERLLLGWG